MSGSRITTAVQLRLSLPSTYCDDTRQYDYYGDPKLKNRVKLLEEALLQKAIQIELAEFRFWLNELNRSYLEFETASKVAYRIRKMRQGLPDEGVPDDFEDRVVFFLKRHAIKRVKALFPLIKDLESGKLSRVRSETYENPRYAEWGKVPYSWRCNNYLSRSELLLSFIKKWCKDVAELDSIKLKCNAISKEQKDRLKAKQKKRSEEHAERIRLRNLGEQTQ
jgi:hypothetical protein